MPKPPQEDHDGGTQSLNTNGQNGQVRSSSPPPFPINQDGLDSAVQSVLSYSSGEEAASKQEPKYISSQELVNNDITKALNAYSRQRISCIPEAVLEGSEIDWTKKSNAERFLDLRKLTRNIFWALEQELQSLADNTSIGSGSPFGAAYRPAAPHAIVKLVRHERFVAFYTALTCYALFGPDLLESQGYTPYNQENKTLALLNTFVLAAFFMEQVLLAVAHKGYVTSLRFCIDSLATFSIVGDSIIGLEYLTSDAFVAMRSSRLTKILRIGGRSNKFVRFVQLVRFAPRLQAYTQRSLNDLAFGLWIKRLHIVFNALDTRGSGELDENDVHFFNAVMEAEFPRQRKASAFAATLSKAISEKKKPTMTIKGPIPWSTFIQEFVSTGAGKRTFLRCKEELNCIKESCAIVEAASGRATMKVCIMVVMLLLTMQVLLSPSEDTSLRQGLHQADSLATSSKVTPAETCDFIKNHYSKALGESNILLLILNRKTFWKEGCRCCNLDIISNASPLSPSQMQELGDEAARNTGFEAHEVVTHEVLNANGQPRSWITYDIHKKTRRLAVNSLIQTSLVVFLLTTLVLYFATDMRKLSNENVLYPLWNLMDDMCALRSIEVLATTKTLAVDPTANALCRRSLSAGPSIMSKCRFRAKIPVADELLQLRAAFDRLHLAMQSWSKYVPLILLKQLFEAHVEASIGCSFVDVSVVFIAFHDFKGVCENVDAQQVLDLMSEVLQAIHDALDDHGGIMLEFIGDEVLAVFGAPVEIVAYQLSAIRATLEAQENVTKLHYPNVWLESSVHKARVLAGNLGSPTRMKYGVLGDGVNLTARLKSLNTRYDTQLLVSSDALDFPGVEDIFLVRPVGDLILKGRTTPTKTFEVIDEVPFASSVQKNAVKKHIEAFKLFQQRDFVKARKLFGEVSEMGLQSEGVDTNQDKVALHLGDLCATYAESPPAHDWDGSEHLTKKAF